MKKKKLFKNLLIIVPVFLILLVAATFFADNIVKKEVRTLNSQPDTTSVAKLTISSYAPTSDNIFDGLQMGHSFITIENTSDSDILLPHYTLETNKTTTLGIWTQSNHWGVWYNIEGVYLPQNKYDGFASISVYIDDTQLTEINSYIENNNKWALWYNCANFAADIWNIAANNSKINLGMQASPKELYLHIKNFDTHVINLNIETEQSIYLLSKNSATKYILKG